MQSKSQLGPGNTLQDQSISNQSTYLQLASIVIIFFLAMAIRVPYLNTPGIGRDREYRSALIARAYYFEMTNSVPEWRQNVALASKQRAGILEPPIMELLVSMIYRVVNGEHLWLARLLASGFWLIGGIFLFKVAKRLVSFEAALFSTTYFLFVPLGVQVSRSFGPNPFMIMMFLFGIFTIVRYYDQPSMIRLVIAASISGLAILVKPFVLFALLGAFFSLVISTKATTPPSRGDRNIDENGERGDIPQTARTNRIFKAVASLKQLINRQVLIFIVVSLLPTVLYYGYGIFISYSQLLSLPGRWKPLTDIGCVSCYILPQLLLSQEYWKDWLLTATGAVGYVAFVAGLVGLPMLRKGMPRTLLIGLWIGYAVFCLVFSNHIRFAASYHLQLIIIVALSFGPIIMLVINHLRQSTNQWYWWLPAVGALMLVALFNLREVRSRLDNHRILESEELAQEIGEMVGHSRNTVYLAHHYGMPLEYYGELSGSNWPRSLSDRDQALGLNNPRSVEERITALGFTPEYFVVTNFVEFNNHHADLQRYLSDYCSLLWESDQYLIYGKCGI